jgi:hypothetical protein
VLTLVANEPNRRGKQREGDIHGTFDYWFDGGAVSMLTGSIRYDLADGTVAHRDVSPRHLSLTILFPGGERVVVRQDEPPAPPEAPKD